MVTPQLLCFERRPSMLVDGIYPAPHEWGGGGASPLLLHFEGAAMLWSFNAATEQADARLIGHLGRINQVRLRPLHHF